MSIQIRWLTVLLTLSLLPSLAWPQERPAAPAAPQVEELTLEQAIALALQENRQVKIVGLEFDKFSDRLAVLKTRRLPLFEFSLLATELINTVEFNMKKGDLGSLTNVGPIPETDITIKAPRRPAFFTTANVFQPLSQQYRLSLMKRKLETGREIAAVQLRGKQLEIANNVKRVYFAVLQSQSALQSVEQTLKLYQEDDDYRAQVEQAVAGVRAAEAAIENNQRQKALQDARIMQSQAGIEAAKAQVEQARAGIEASKAKIVDAKAAVQATKADVVRTESERRRQESLVEASAATRQRLEQVVADAERFRSILASREAELEQANAGLAVRKSDLAQAEAALLGRNADWEAQRRQRAVLDSQEGQLRADLNAKRAGLKVAETNLEYTRIVAPADGIVGERKVRAGQLVSPGTQALSLVQSEPWVLANYKETQLTNVRKGDPVEITVDGLPGVKIKGRVEEIAPASGSQFALLPPDNATGNFTKIVQRIPVKIVLDADPNVRERLRPGMSVISKIKTGSGRDRVAAAPGEKQ